jgi:hypothetical protein
MTQALLPELRWGVQMSHHGLIAMSERMHAGSLDPEPVADQPQMPPERGLAEWLS